MELQGHYTVAITVAYLICLANICCPVECSKTITCQRPTSWITQKSDLCYTANEPGNFTVDRNGVLVAIRLLHKSGKLYCGHKDVTSPSRWGCVYNKYCKQSLSDQKYCLSTFITDKNGTKLFPPDSDNGLYDLPGFGREDDVLVFKPTWLSKSVVEGQVFRLEYGFKDSGSGEHCVQVDASYYE